MGNVQAKTPVPTKPNRASAFSKIIGVIAISAAVIGFSFRYLSITADQEEQIRVLERSLAELRAAINVDSERQRQIQKVLNLLDKYNKEMPAHDKYAIANEVFEMSVKYANLDLDLICATITHESGRSWDPKVVSPAGAMGLMQIMPLTGMYVSELEGITWTTPEEILFNPLYNIRMGSRYLSSMINSYDVDGGLAAYNGGERIAARWIRNNRADGILWAETSKYVPSVLQLYEKYRNIN